MHTKTKEIIKLKDGRYLKHHHSPYEAIIIFMVSDDLDRWVRYFTVSGSTKYQVMYEGALDLIHVVSQYDEESFGHIQLVISEIPVTRTMDPLIAYDGMTNIIPAPYGIADTTELLLVRESDNLIHVYWEAEVEMPSAEELPGKEITKVDPISTEKGISS